MANLVFIQNPLLETFENWSAQLRIDLTGFDIPISYPVANWWEWASQFIKNNNNLTANVPLPTRLSYPKEEDWKRWVLFTISSTSIFKIA